MAGRLPNPIMLTLVVGEEDGMPEYPSAKEKLHTYIHTYIHTCDFSTAVPFRTSFSCKE
jgi:hypothetical protein